MSYKVQPPLWLRAFFKGAIWRKTQSEKCVYLTFDDGPVEKETLWVVELLKKFNIKATFFCVGENAKRHPHLMEVLLQNGHSVGNHTFNHLPAWKCSRSAYFENIEKGKQYVPGKLFRPPHGQLYPWYMSALKKQFKEIVMWDVLAMDYDKRLSKQTVVNNVMNHVRNGSVIVFHDSKKAWERMSYALPICLEKLQKEGYTFKVFKMQ